jgi:hypothetical protein
VGKASAEMHPQPQFTHIVFLRNPIEELLRFCELRTKSLWNSCGELDKACITPAKAMKFRKFAPFPAEE